MNSLNNKVAIVTGAAKGIGAAIAQHFSQAGAKVIFNYASSHEAAGSLVKSIFITLTKQLLFRPMYQMRLMYRGCLMKLKKLLVR